MNHFNQSFLYTFRTTMSHAIEIKEEIYDLEDVANINSNIEFVETKQVKSETFVDVSEIKPEKLDFSI